MPVTHYFVRNTSRTKDVDYLGKIRKKMTLVICGRLLHGHNATLTTRKKGEVTCKKCLTHKL